MHLENKCIVAMTLKKIYIFIIFLFHLISSKLHELSFSSEIISIMYSLLSIIFHIGKKIILLLVKNLKINLYLFDTYSVHKEDVVTTSTKHNHIRVFAWTSRVPQPWKRFKRICEHAPLVLHKIEHISKSITP